MNVRGMVVAVTVSLAFVAASASADSLGKGTSEVSGFIGFKSTSTNGASASGVSLDAEYGYFLTPNWEIAPGIEIGSESSNGSSASDHAGLLSGIYNFPRSGNLIPYARAGIAFGRTSSGGTSIGFMTLPQVGAGVRYIKWKTAAVNGCVYYQRTELSKRAGNATSNTIGVRVGVSWFPKGF